MRKFVLAAGLTLLALSPVPSTIGITSADVAQAQGQTWRLYYNGVRTGRTFSSLSSCQAAGRSLAISMGGGNYSCVRE